MEVAAINAGLQPWDDAFIETSPQPLPPLRMIIAPAKHKYPRNFDEKPDAGGAALMDRETRVREGDWVAKVPAATGADRPRGLGYRAGVRREPGLQRHGGVLRGGGTAAGDHRSGARGHRPGAARVCGAGDDRAAGQAARGDAGQKQLEQQFEEERDKWEFEQIQRDREEYLDRKHQLELRRQQGEEIDPEEFSPSEQDPYPTPPWEKAGRQRRRR